MASDAQQPATRVNKLLKVEALRVTFSNNRGLRQTENGLCHAVDGVSFDIPEGSTLGLVGESGCGKTTLARAIIRLEQASSGKITFDGHDVLHARGRELQYVRRHLQIIFQDPIGSLNPRMQIEDIVAEPLVIHHVGDRTSRRKEVFSLLERVGLDPGEASRYPHEFSGGQRQRIGIARAIALKPKMIICDEPVSALDVSVQAQILNLLADLKDELNLTLLFITHNLAVARHISDRIAVMKSGKIIESADAEILFSHPQHPYTQALIRAVPTYSALSKVTI